MHGESTYAMAKMKIRNARPEDLPAIEEIFKSHHTHHDWKYAERYFRSYFASSQLHTGDMVLVGVIHDRVIGVVGYLQDKAETDDVYWLGWFYVHNREKGCNHGTKLLNYVISDLKKKGARKLYTDTSSWKFYARAHHRYKEYGFKKEAKIKDYYEKGEDQIIYGMTLT